MQRLRVLIIFGLLVTLPVVIFGCTRSRSYPRASLYRNIVKPRTQDGPFSGRALYRIAVANTSSPKETLRIYGPVVDYLSRKLGVPAQLVLAHSYAELNQMMGSGDVTAAFVCSRGYVDGRDSFGLELVAAPAYHGRPAYYCYIIASTGINAVGIRDFRGLSFAFTERGSNTGCLVPTYQIEKLGERPESFFGRVIYTGSHDRSIAAVRDGIVEGAAVDSIIYEQAIREDPDLRKRTRIVSRYGPYGAPPVVVSPLAPKGFKMALSRALLNMHRDSEGQRLLNMLMADRFVEVDDSTYESIRKMIREVRTSVRGTWR